MTANAHHQTNYQTQISVFICFPSTGNFGHDSSSQCNPCIKGVQACLLWDLSSTELGLQYNAKSTKTRSLICTTFPYILRPSANIVRYHTPSQIQETFQFEKLSIFTPKKDIVIYQILGHILGEIINSITNCVIIFTIFLNIIRQFIIFLR